MTRTETPQTPASAVYSQHEQRSDRLHSCKKLKRTQVLQNYFSKHLLRKKQKQIYLPCFIKHLLYVCLILVGLVSHKQSQRVKLGSELNKQEQNAEVTYITAEMWSTTVVGTTKLHYSGRGWVSFATQLTALGHLSSKAPVICSPSDRTLHPPSAWLRFSCCISQVNTLQLHSCLHVPSELSLYHTLPRSLWNPELEQGGVPAPHRYPVCQALHPAQALQPMPQLIL